MKSRKIRRFLLIVIFCIGILIQNKTYGALQSNGGTPATKDVNSWITQIRQMQTAGQSLGLTDTINSNLTSGNKNLDIHMEKNTEYGAVILLGASTYGNSNKMNTNGVTTTGNKTGVVMNINKEWVAAGISNTNATSMKNAANRYKNVYADPIGNSSITTDNMSASHGSSNYKEKSGDAILTVGGWHGSSKTTWLSSNNNTAQGNKKCGLIRAYSGSVFSYYGYSCQSVADYDGVNDNYRRDAHYTRPWASRAVVVTGSGV